MSFQRVDALTYVYNRYSKLAALTGVLNTDSDAGYKQPIDDAFTIVAGTSWSDLQSAYVEDHLVSDMKLALRYTALCLFEEKLLSEQSYELSATGLKEMASNPLAQVMKAKAYLEEQLTGKGYVIEGSGTLEWLPLDIYEPDTD